MLRGGSKLNLRLIFTVSILSVVVLLAIAVVLVGYAVATRHAIGNFAPFGNAVNVKTK
jgi:hypothetical protein